MKPPAFDVNQSRGAQNVSGVVHMQFNFKRYEKKYLVTHKQAAAVTAALLKHMTLDEYGTYWVQNIYMDTDNWDVINKSLEKPLYKEKMRLRCYGIPDETSNIFLELKKKFAGVVYKRRMAFSLEALKHPLREVLSKEDQQIAKELDFYLKGNPVDEKMFIAFRRTAYTGVENPGLRVTFDNDVRYRCCNLDFTSPEHGRQVLHENYQLMEIKTPISIPLWLSRALSENGIYRTSYSKYGTCFTDYCAQKGDVKLYA